MNGPDQILPSTNLTTHLPDGTVTISDGVSYSVPTFLKRSCEKYSQNTAMAIKRNFEWKKWTYTELMNDVRIAARAFIELGLRAHYSVGILADNCPEWTISLFGTIFAGGIAVGIYTSTSQETLEFIITQSRISILIIDDESQLSKIKDIYRNENLVSVIVLDPKFSGNDNKLLNWSQLLDLGRYREESERILGIRLSNIAINQCCGILYTSGTSGDPKGVMTSHYNYISATVITASHIQIPDEMTLVSFLPLSHIAGQLFEIWIPLLGGSTVYFADKNALKGTLLRSLLEIQPTFFLAVPRVWEKLHHYIRGLQSESENLCVRKQLGLERCIFLANGGAPLPLETFDFFESHGLVIWDGYGMTETTGPHSAPNPSHIKRGSVGIPIYELKLGENNEILMRGPNVMMGYISLPGNEALDQNGWLHSGDSGFLDDEGFLYIRERLKDIFITSGGENICPSPIENAIKAQLPIVSNAVCIGDGKKFISLLLTLKTEKSSELESWCLRHNIKELTVTNNQVSQVIDEKIKKVNESARNNVHKIKKWTLLNSDFTLPGGEIGPTMKLKRSLILAKYAKEIEKMYLD